MRFYTDDQHQQLKAGYFTDKYFNRVEQIIPPDLQVEMQIFTRHAPYTLVAGIDPVLEILSTYAKGIEIEAIPEGKFVTYNGNPLEVLPVLKIRGTYATFAHLETPILGILGRASRIATNVYGVIEAADGKPILFFPARFDTFETQALDGYAYQTAINAYPYNIGSHVSTDAQGAWIGLQGEGTVPHALIASYGGSTVQAMRAYAETQPPNMPRIALVDFENDVCRTSLEVLKEFWYEYMCAYLNGDSREMKRWTLTGVRLDTGGSMVDVSLAGTGLTGVNPELVRKVRRALDGAWTEWNVPEKETQRARNFCHQVQIIVTGGFNADKIRRFHNENVPVDVYGVGSGLLTNDKETNCDFTADIVKIKQNGEWIPVAKVGRQACENPALSKVTF